MDLYISKHHPGVIKHVRYDSMTPHIDLMSKEGSTSQKCGHLPINLLSPRIFPTLQSNTEDVEGHETQIWNFVPNYVVKKEEEICFIFWIP